MSINLLEEMKVMKSAEETKDSATEGNVDMEAMTNTMMELKKSSDEVVKIIKVIDDIAFQTNILALNAAVEELSAQSKSMKKMVAELNMIVNGDKKMI